MKKAIPLQFYPGVDGRWFWRAVAPNGRIVADCAQGNGYKTVLGAEKGARAALRALQASLAPRRS